MIRALLLSVGLILLLGACTQRLVCPAYQSSFIYDKEAMRKKFSYFKEDSTPKILTASKNKYLIAVPESYRKKMRNLKTVEAKPVFPVIPDSLKLDKGKDQLMAEADVVDSTSAPADSVYAITKTKEKYNVDQDIYMWYFRDLLVLPDVRAAMETQNKNKQAADATEKKKKKGLFSFLRKKQPADSLAVEEPLITPNDSTASQPKKKGLFGLFGGKKASKKPADEKKKEDGKKEEEDGF
jgi:hypothetical protein